MRQLFGGAPLFLPLENGHGPPMPFGVLPQGSLIPNKNSPIGSFICELVHQDQRGMSAIFCGSPQNAPAALWNAKRLRGPAGVL